MSLSKPSSLRKFAANPHYISMFLLLPVVLGVLLAFGAHAAALTAESAALDAKQDPQRR